MDLTRRLQGESTGPALAGRNPPGSQQTTLDLGIVSVVPSPYQRDLFHALARRPDVRLKIYYLERSAPDSPWPEEPLQPYETILPGFWVSVAGARFHVVSQHPRLDQHQFLVLNSLTSSLSQWKLRFRSKSQKLLFWAEPLRAQSAWLRSKFQGFLTSPIIGVDAIVGIGSQAVKLYKEHWPSVPCFNVPYHCDLAQFFENRATFQGLKEEVRFLFCGQLISRKGVDVLLQAFDRLVHKAYPVRLLLVGRRAELDQMLTMVSTEAKDRISYQGFFDPKRLSDIYSQAHVFVLPSRYDGWGVVVNQALGAGLPVICTDAVGAGYDLVNEGINGYRVTAGDAEELTSRMENLIVQRERIPEFGAASRRLAEAFTPDQGADKWSKLLLQLV
jgi:glycosyltransferase involved in cell wall biosynthesis